MFSLKLSPKPLILRVLSIRKRLQIFLSWRAFEFFIFMLIIVYMVLVFATFAIDDPSLSQTIENVERVSFVLKIIEIVILAIFCFEISLKILAFGFTVNSSLKTAPHWILYRSTSRTSGSSSTPSSSSSASSS